MDWLEDFEKKFSNCIEFHDLKKNRLHGSVTINFSDGIPHNCELKVHLRGESNPNEGRIG